MKVFRHVRDELLKHPEKYRERTFPYCVKVVEVSPRDGLQNEKQMVPVETKVNLIDMLSGTGISVIEPTSFVSPKAVPQLADGAEVLNKIKRVDGVNYPVLCPNVKGLENALKCDVKEIAIFGAASEEFTKKNINCTIEESLARFEAVMTMAKENKIRVRGYVSCVMGCPYEGEIDPNLVKLVSEKLLEMGCYEISLGDTIGIGTPEQTETLLDTLTTLPKIKLAAHFHNTYDRAIPNLLTAFSRGIVTSDSSVAGIGGCPYAKGASGNVPTEDVLYLCELLGIHTGVNLPEVIKAGEYISNELGRENLASVTMDDLDMLPEQKGQVANFLKDIQYQNVQH